MSLIFCCHQNFAVFFDDKNCNKYDKKTYNLSHVLKCGNYISLLLLKMRSRKNPFIFINNCCHTLFGHGRQMFF